MPEIDLALFGSAQVTVDGHAPLTFPTQKTFALLAYLAVERGRPHRREALAGLLWPELPDVTARSNLRKTLERLRAALGAGDVDPGAKPLLWVDAQVVQFNPEAVHRLDVVEFEALLLACERHTHRGLDACPACAHRLAQALDLYCGDFLVGFSIKDSAPFEEWALIQREHYRRQAVSALDSLIARYERLGEHEAARRWLVRQLELEPWREESHRNLMIVLGLLGQRSQALAQYATCRRALKEELDVEPAPETVALAERITFGPDLAEPPQVLERRARRLALPVPPTPLVGRTTELAALNELLSDPGRRLVTLLGLGGAGKTHLALATAPTLESQFSHGAAFVPLAGLSTADLAPAAIMAALGETPAADKPPAESLVSYLRQRQLLVILDSAEHLLSTGDGGGGSTGADAPTDLLGLVLDILAQAPGVALLVTSRERLAVRAEWVLEVAGLPVPDVDATDAEAIAACDSVRLFVDRSRQAFGPAALTHSDFGSVKRICRLVEGLPLAIELAVAGSRHQSLARLAEELEQGLVKLANAPRDVPVRHRSLRATLEHSWDLLSLDERAVLGRLSVFRGGCDESAAIAVAGASVEALGSLADKSLVRLSPDGRYVLHELVRQFGIEKLAEAGEEPATRERHLTYFADGAEQREQALEVRREAWAPTFSSEHDNLVAALTFARDHGLESHGLRLASCLWYYWARFGLAREGQSWLEWFLERIEPIGDIAVAWSRGMDGLGLILWRLGDLPRAAACIDRALVLKRALNDRPGLALALAHRGIVHAYSNTPSEAEAVYLESLALYRDLGDRLGTTVALQNLGNLAVQSGENGRAIGPYEECLRIYHDLGDPAGEATISLGLGTIALEARDLSQAHSYFERSRSLAQSIGDPYTQTTAMNALGGLALERGELDQAEALLEQTWRLCESLDDSVGVATARTALGSVALARGDIDGAARHLKDSVRHFAAVNAQEGLVECFERLADVAIARACPETAVHLIGAAGHLRRNIGAPLPEYRLDLLDRVCRGLRIQLGDDGYERHRAVGERQSIEQCVAESATL
ncbi:MAG: tetratricopeptide repeat protein [Anaerolineales bacterium]|nr:tetratricopeptide repeat protein [Anaerolineales bacterium]